MESNKDSQKVLPEEPTEELPEESTEEPTEESPEKLPAVLPWAMTVNVDKSIFRGMSSYQSVNRHGHKVWKYAKPPTLNTNLLDAINKKFNELETPCQLASDKGIVFC
jgi:hypothetical protein